MSDTFDHYADALDNEQEDAVDYCESCQREISNSQSIRYDGFCQECHDNAEWFKAESAQ